MAGGVGPVSVAEFLHAHQLLVIVLVLAVAAGVAERWCDRRGR